VLRVRGACCAHCAGARAAAVGGVCITRQLHAAPRTLVQIIPPLDALWFSQRSSCRPLAALSTKTKCACGSTADSLGARRALSSFFYMYVYIKCYAAHYNCCTFYRASASLFIATTFLSLRSGCARSQRGESCCWSPISLESSSFRVRAQKYYQTPSCDLG
jgi:hypothetical protein